MTLRGRIQKGLVLLEDGEGAPDGAEVEVQVLKKQRLSRRKSTTAFDALRPFIGLADDLPSDASANVDHYLRGAPRGR